MNAVQRTVDAAAAPRPLTTAPRSVFDMAPGITHDHDAGEEEEAPPPKPSAGIVNAFGSAPPRVPTRTPPKEQETPMSDKKRTRATKGASVQFQMLALLATGDMSREALKKKVQGDDKQLANAIFNAKKAGRIAWLEGRLEYRITKAGREWVTGGANLDNQQRHATTTSPATVKTSRRTKPRAGKDLDAAEQLRAGVVQVDRSGQPVATPAPPARPSLFRCAIFNDGSFFITKGGTEIELDAAEHKQLLTYLDRLAEPLARAA